MNFLDSLARYGKNAVNNVAAAALPKEFEDILGVNKHPGFKPIKPVNPQTDGYYSRLLPELGSLRTMAPATPYTPTSPGVVPKAPYQPLYAQFSQRSDTPRLYPINSIGSQQPYGVSYEDELTASQAVQPVGYNNGQTTLNGGFLNNIAQNPYRRIR